MTQKNYIDPTAIIIGDVELGDGVSIWPYAVLRGDEGSIVIGDGSNVQDHAVIHVGRVGRNVTVGHGAIINNAMVGNDCIIGLNSSLLDNAVVGDECIIGAGAVVTGNTIIPPRSVVVGVPGRIMKSEDRTIRARALESAEIYHKLRDEHLAGRYTRRMGP
jgi:carbonic anhydrase/acetyltransferase-like protein (isoleucine patch superfamily)